MDRQHHRPPTLQLWPSFERLGRAYLDSRVELLLGRHACLCACGGVRRAFASSSETLGYRSRLCAACSVGGSGGSWEPLMSQSIFDQPARLVPWFCALVKTKTRRTPATAASSIRASERLWRREAFVARSEPPPLATAPKRMPISNAPHDQATVVDRISVKSPCFALRGPDPRAGWAFNFLPKKPIGGVARLNKSDDGNNTPPSSSSSSHDMTTHRIALPVLFPLLPHKLCQCSIGIAKALRAISRKQNTHKTK
jgi:hypothetical protein